MEKTINSKVKRQKQIESCFDLREFNDKNFKYDKDSYVQGARWADYHPWWREDKPKYEENEYDDLPKLRLCQVMILDMTYGWRYSYRVGFITRDGQWNIEANSNNHIHVVRWMEIFGNETIEQKIEDIDKLNKKIVDDQLDDIRKENKVA